MSTVGSASVQRLHRAVQHHVRLSAPNGQSLCFLHRGFSLAWFIVPVIAAFLHVSFSQDVALLDKLIKEDIEAGKLPLLLVANAGQFMFDVQVYHL